MPKIRLSVVLLPLLLSMNAVAAPLGIEDVKSLPEAKVELALPESHPAVLYVYAARLFRAGRKDEAVMWFYAGQLRYRFYLRSNPKLPPDGEPAVFAALTETFGEEINGWAGGSPRDWVAAIDRALKWDEANPNTFTSKSQNAVALQETRQGLAELRNKIIKSEAQIRARREQLGLPNR
jgi:hypothetical protein